VLPATACGGKSSRTLIEVMSSALDRSHNPRKLVKVQFTSSMDGTTPVDFSNGFPFFYVDAAGMMHPRLDAEGSYTFMSNPTNITPYVSIDMEARRQIKTVSAAFESIITDFLEGVIIGNATKLYVYRSAFAKLYQATTLNDGGVPTVSTVPPQFVSADTLAAPTAGTQVIGGNTYSGYSMPAHTFWAADTPLVIEFTDDGDSTVKYLTIHNPATTYGNVAYATIN
jgi:hypothetical protein